MKTAIAAALLSVLALASAAPAPNGRDQPIGPPHRTSSDSSIIYPMMTSTYESWSDHVNDGVAAGLVRNNHGISTPVSTYMTFDVPASAASKRCQFNLRLSDTATVTGTGTAGVLTWLDSLSHRPGTWGGWIHAVRGDVASLPPIDCPAGHKYSVELTAYGDENEIKWNVYSEGPEIVIS
ncbi:MAG: hypothetical protein M1839_000992 [Geoglossum umbratile]|nr:MAG: hypothetical protein M1839_000992 [Geoglossum umbratile]